MSPPGKLEAVYRSADAAELETMRAALAGALRRRLLRWAARWTLGFALVGTAAYLRPDWAWLVWAAAAIAAASLAFTLAAHALAQRRIARAAERIAHYERVAAQAERQARLGEDPH